MSTERDIDMAMEGWNTVGKLEGCAEATDSLGRAHKADCECPPYLCNDCGQSQPQTQPCGCFIRLDQMALPDIKALFAEGAPDLSLDLPKDADR